MNIREKLSQYLKSSSKEYILKHISIAVQIFLEEHTNTAVFFTADEMELKVFKTGSGDKNLSREYIQIYPVDKYSFYKICQEIEYKLEDIDKSQQESINQKYTELFSMLSLFYNDKQNYHNLLNKMIAIGEKSYFEAVKKESPLRYYRLKSGLKVSQVASEMNCNIQHIYAWEAGRRSPSPQNMKKLGDIYKVDVKTLFFELKVEHRL